MKKTYVLDACALVACLADEEGAGVVQNILDMARCGECEVFMHAVNLLEVYYNVRKEYGEAAAKEMFDGVMEERVIICSDMSEGIIFEAGRLKSRYKISLADSIGLAQTVLFNASFVTSDHHEMDTVDGAEDIDFTWFR